VRILRRDAMTRRLRRFNVSPIHTTRALLRFPPVMQRWATTSLPTSAKHVLKRTPDFSVEKHLTTQHYKHHSDLEHYRAALLKAGLSITAFARKRR
jgi:hypothetical protein